MCFQERAGSRIGGSSEEALHDRGVFSGHYDECRGSGARQGTLNPRTTNTRKPSPTNQPTLHQCPPPWPLALLVSLQFFRLLHGYSPGYNTPCDGRSIYIYLCISLALYKCIYILSIFTYILCHTSCSLMLIIALFFIETRKPCE